MSENTTGLKELAEYVVKQSAPTRVTEPDDGAIHVVVAPQGQTVIDLKPFQDARLTAPRRAIGTSKHTTIASFVAHILKFKDEGTAIFANAKPDDPKVLSIYNYNSANDKPRFGDHRSELALELSDEWKIWTEQAGEAMNQGVFAEFIEANIGDIQNAPDLKDETNAVLREVSMMLAYPFAGQADMMKLSKGIAVNESTKAKAQVNLQTGERTIQFESEHTDADGMKLTVPGLFLIAIPVFKDAHIYRLPVRLRYRVAGGGVSWSFDIYRDDKAFKLAYDEACATIEQETGVKLYVGEPETTR